MDVVAGEGATGTDAGANRESERVKANIDHRSAGRTHLAERARAVIRLSLSPQAASVRA